MKLSFKICFLFVASAGLLVGCKKHKDKKNDGQYLCSVYEYNWVVEQPDSGSQYVDTLDISYSGGNYTIWGLTFPADSLRKGATYSWGDSTLGGWMRFEDKRFYSYKYEADDSTGITGTELRLNCSNEGKKI